MSLLTYYVYRPVSNNNMAVERIGAILYLISAGMSLIFSIKSTTALICCSDVH